MALNDLLAQGGGPRSPTLLDEYLTRGDNLRKQAMLEKEAAQMGEYRNLRMQKMQQDMEAAEQQRTEASELKGLYDQWYTSGRDLQGEDRKKWLMQGLDLSMKTGNVGMGQIIAQRLKEYAPTEKTWGGIPIGDLSADMQSLYLQSQGLLPEGAGDGEELRWVPPQVDKGDISAVVENSPAFKRLGGGNEEDKDQMKTSVDLAVNSLIRAAAQQNREIRPDQAIDLVLQAADAASSASWTGDKFDSAVFNSNVERNFDSWVQQASPVGAARRQPSPPPTTVEGKVPDNVSKVPTEAVTAYKTQFPEHANLPDDVIARSLLKQYGSVEGILSVMGESIEPEVQPQTEPAPIEEEQISGAVARRELDTIAVALQQLSDQYAKTLNPKLQERINQLMARRRELISMLESRPSERLQGGYL